ncbi:MAG: twin-arginine translocation signal domain-containing protein [Desulforhopalus sp.]|nr:twin-arginine translocation signal domain-containing protein [Desulforhopalus sp.]
MENNKTDEEMLSDNDVLDAERREALKKLAALGIAAATAPVMITLLEARQASAQSGRT